MTVEAAKRKFTKRMLSEQKESMKEKRSEGDGTGEQRQVKIDRLRFR